MRILLIILIALMFRFSHLGRIPNAISGDELHYAVTAKSIAQTGRDISGTWNPLSLAIFRYPPQEEQAELPYVLHLLSSAFFPFSLFLFKLPFAILGVGTVLLLYAIAYTLFTPLAALCTGIIAAMNPWFVVMDRTGYEASPATFFYLLGFFVLLKLKKWNILLSLIPFLLAFYSYIATKVIFVPFILTSCLLAYFGQKRKFAAQYIIVSVISIAVVFVFYFLFKTNPQMTRLNDIFLPHSPMVADQVNEIRQTAIQSPLLPFFANKFTIYMQIMASKLLRIFSPAYLFSEGDQFFLPGKQSFFYYLDAIFLFVGSVSIFAKKKFYGLLLGIFLLIGTFPHLLNITMGDFSIHLSLMFPFLILIIGYGLAETIQSIPKKLHFVSIPALILLYAVNVAGFIVVYFWQYPLSGDADFPMRVLTRYVQLAKLESNSIVIYAASPADLFNKYIFYSNAITKENIPDLSRRIFSQDIEFQGVNFFQCKTKEQQDKKFLRIYDRNCDIKIEESRTAITTLVDGAETYKILNDTVCSRYNLTKYPQKITTADFEIEQLNEKDFCETYISVR